MVSEAFSADTTSYLSWRGNKTLARFDFFFLSLNTDIGRYQSQVYSKRCAQLLALNNEETKWYYIWHAECIERKNTIPNHKIVYLIYKPSNKQRYEHNSMYKTCLHSRGLFYWKLIHNTQVIVMSLSIEIDHTHIATSH